MPVFGGELPVGAGLLWYSDTAPSSFLICDGSSLSRATYAKLFAVLGTTYGSADANSFNLPDLRQRFPLGKAASGTGNSLAGTGGAIDHTHTSAAHTHTVPAHYHGMGTGATLAVDIAHTHGSSSVTGTVGGTDGTHSHTASSTTAGAHSHTYSITYQTNTANADAGTRLKGTDGTGTTRTNTTALTIDSGGGHTHPITVNTTNSEHGHSHSLTAAGQTIGATSKTPTGLVGLVTGGVDGNAAMTSGSTTPSATGANNPPYVVVNYIIKFQ